MNTASAAIANAPNRPEPVSPGLASPGSASPGLGSWFGVSWSSRRLLLIGICLLVILPAALGIMIWKLRENTIDDAHQNLGNLGVAIAEQTSRSVQAAHLVLEDLQHTIATHAPTSIASFKAGLANESLYRFLKDRADFLPQVDAFTVIAADGKLVNYSRRWPAPPTDLSDRDYLEYFRTHDTTAPFVSAPVQNRGTGGWTVYLARRINAPSGEFIGMVLASINLDYFRDVFNSIAGGAGTTVTLLRNDGIALTSYPPTAHVGDALPAESPWYGIVASGHRQEFETAGVLAPGWRLVSVHPLSDYPLVINISIAINTVLLAWMQIASVTAACTLAATICVGLLIRALFRQYGRLEWSERQLEHRNAALQDSQQELLTQAGELSRSRSAVAEQSATLELALRHMNQGILMVGADQRVVVCNERAAAMLDLPQDLLAARPSFDELIAYQSSQGEFNDPSAAIRAGSFANALVGLPTYERTRPNGTVLEVQTVVMPQGGLVRTYTDITSRRQSEQQVKFLALHDPLTGLFNRNAFHEQLDGAVRAGTPLAVYYIDLDGFKQVNDTHGHPVGDQLLTVVGTRLRQAVRDNDVIARMGGDEFSVIQPFTGSPSHLAEIASRILLSVGRPVQVGQVRCSVGVSIGIALFPDHAEDPAALLQHADTALYRAKAGGRGAYCLFDPAMDQEVQFGTILRQGLALALSNGELHMEYQPIVDATSLAVVRFEALLRWRHPVHGAVSPATFIPIAEQSGLIIPIGLWALQTSCAAAATWPGGIEVSVNLSPVQFATGDLPQQVEQVLQRTGLDPRQLNFEITEGVLLENTDLVLDAMARLRRLGIRFSLDDFGTAHAGLTYLRRFPFDVLKIDKSFVQGAAQDPQARALLGAIQAVGEACNLKVVAEGVETVAELAVVRDLTCDQVQGYLTGRPNVVAVMTQPQLLALAS